VGEKGKVASSEAGKAGGTREGDVAPECSSCFAVAQKTKPWSLLQAQLISKTNPREPEGCPLHSVCEHEFKQTHCIPLI
jgi:hypothetical protein